MTIWFFFASGLVGYWSMNARNSARCSAVEGRRFVSLVLVLVASFLTNLVVAAEDFARSPTQPFQEPAFLPVDEARNPRRTRRFGSSANHLGYRPDYYLYRHQFSVRVDGVKVDQLQIPAGQEKFDEFFGDVEVYYQFAELTLSGTRLDEGAQLVVMYQGCAELGLCYPPEQRQFIYTGGRLLASSAVTQVPASATMPQAIGEDRALADVLANASLITVLAVFFVAGVGLTFTPCVFPMLPILSSIIVGQGKDLAKPRALSLSAAYVLGMAVTFAAVGLLVGLFGAELNLQAKLQSPAVLILSALIFTALAGAMFGFYELTLPQALQQWLDDRARRNKPGGFWQQPPLGFCYGCSVQSRGLAVHYAAAGWRPDLFVEYRRCGDRRQRVIYPSARYGSAINDCRWYRRALATTCWWLDGFGESCFWGWLAGSSHLVVGALAACTLGAAVMGCIAYWLRGISWGIGFLRAATGSERAAGDGDPCSSMR